MVNIPHGLYIFLYKMKKILKFWEGLKGVPQKDEISFFLLTEIHITTHVKPLMFNIVALFNSYPLQFSSIKAIKYLTF